MGIGFICSNKMKEVDYNGWLLFVSEVFVQRSDHIFKITIITAHEKGGNKDELQREDSDKCQMGC